jgi:hypothetical protein
MEFRLSDSAGNQDPFVRITSTATAVTSGGETSSMTFGLGIAGTIVGYLLLGTAALRPVTNDAIALGSATISWSDLYLADGAVINFNNSDVLITHGTDSLLISGGRLNVSQGINATNPSILVTQDNDTAQPIVAVFQGDRATPTAGDSAVIPFRLSDSAGNQDTAFQLQWGLTAVTSGSETGYMRMALMSAGTLTNRLDLYNTSLTPVTNDNLALGTVANNWSDLFLASGGVINFNNGNATITHVTGGFEVGGTFRARTALSTETSGVLTSASANKRVKATAGVTINDGVFTAEDAIEIYNDSDVSITITQDTGMTLRLAGTTTTGNRTLAARGVAYVYFDTNADAAVAGSGVS